MFNPLPRITIYKNSKKEIIVDASWPTLSLLKKAASHSIQKRYIFIGVGVIGVALGIATSISAFSSQTSLYAETNEVIKPKLTIQKIILPALGKTLIFHDDEKQIQLEETLVVLFDQGTVPVEILQNVEVGDDVFILRSNNGMYSYTLSEIRTIAKEDLTSFFENKKVPLIFYVPENVLKKSYRVYVITEKS